MAYEISPANENYIDTPLSKFPTGIDVFDRMTDVDISTWPLVVEYERFLSDGDFTAATRLLRDNPDLKTNLINAEVINKHADAIMAIENFVLHDIDELYTQVAQNAIGINDNPTEEQASYVSYSAEKINALLEDTKEDICEVKYVTIPSYKWTSSAPYEQTIIVDGVKATDVPTISLSLDDVETESQKKQMQKSWNFVDYITMNDGSITAVCKFKKPTVDMSIVIKGA